MAKRKPVIEYGEQDYPSLEEFRTSRRGFLKNLALGAITLGVGSQVLPACGKFTTSAGSLAPPDYYDVRLPAEGTANAYMNMGDYMTFALTLITYDEAVAEYYRNAEADGVGVATQVLANQYCGNVTDPALRADLEESLRAALEDNVGRRIATNGQGIESVTLLVDSCEENMIAGGEPEPDYP